MSLRVNVTRREFMGGAAAFAAASGAMALSPDRFSALDRPSHATPNYWCSWGMQGKLVRQKNLDVNHLMPAFPGDQGFSPHIRDVITDDMVLGKGGWAETLWPEIRSDLFFLLDDGWDVPYGADQHKDISPFGSMDLDRVKFAGLKGTPGQRLAQLTKGLQDKGWHGLGLWVSPGCQCELLKKTKKGDWTACREEWKRKLAWCAEGGVGYLKVDWGTRNGVDFRRMLSEIKNEIAPHIVMEHCVVQGPLNGAVKNPDGTVRITLRRIGCTFKSELKIIEMTRELLAFSDTYRIYDMLGGSVADAQAIERTALSLKLGEDVGNHALIHVEDTPCLGAVLGCSMGFFRNNGAEGLRAVRWQRLAPAFRSSDSNRVAYSETVLENKCLLTNHWYKLILGKVIAQAAPAAVSRGMPLPEVTKLEADIPYVCAARHPNGALSVGIYARAIEPNKPFFPPADVRLAAPFGLNTPLGVFGRPHAVTVDCAARPGSVRVFAQDLVGSTPKDITAIVRFEGGRLTIPGSALESVQTQPGDPATLVYLA